MDEAAPDDFRPPYLAFTTFWSFINELVAKPLPPRLDRSLMRSKSGSDQAALTAAMKSFGLIDSGQAVTGLRDLASRDEAGRLTWLQEQVRVHYPAQMKVSDEHGTDQQLKESFKEAFGLDSADTTRKAMTFFLHAARTAHIETSANFPSTRSGSGAPGTPKPRRTTSRRRPPASPPTDKGGNASRLTHSGDTYTLTMDSGPVVTMTVAFNVMEASIDDRDFIFEIVDKLRAYGSRIDRQTSGSRHGAAGNRSDATED